MCQHLIGAGALQCARHVVERELALRQFLQPLLEGNTGEPAGAVGGVGRPLLAVVAGGEVAEDDHLDVVLGGRCGLCAKAAQGGQDA